MHTILRLFTLRTITPKRSNSYVMNTIMNEWKVNIREGNSPLLEALSLRVPAAPRAFLRQLCKKQRITVDSHIAEADRCIHAGEIVAVKTSRRWMECLEQSRLQPEQILYEDEQCIVLNKPAGLAIHRAQGHDDNLLWRVQDFLRLRSETFQVAPVHRLDIGTSGAVLFGKGHAAISQLGKMIMAGQATKRYLALVSGCITLPGELNSAVPAKGRAKESLSRFRPLDSTEEFTLLELELVTGRHHQIRHQLAIAGWPIIGDTRYRGKVVNGMNRPFLHCHHLAFPQPANGAIIDVFCPLPEDLRGQLKALGFGPGVLEEKF
jgi:RluA family pseudouridine synthase